MPRNKSITYFYKKAKEGAEKFRFPGEILFSAPNLGKVRGNNIAEEAGFSP